MIAFGLIGEITVGSSWNRTCLPALAEVLSLLAVDFRMFKGRGSKPSFVADVFVGFRELLRSLGFLSFPILQDYDIQRLEMVVDDQRYFVRLG